MVLLIVDSLQSFILFRFWEVHVQVLNNYKCSLFYLEFSYHFLNILCSYFLTNNIEQHRSVFMKQLKQYFLFSKMDHFSKHSLNYCKSEIIPWIVLIIKVLIFVITENPFSEFVLLLGFFWIVKFWDYWINYGVMDLSKFALKMGVFESDEQMSTIFKVIKQKYHVFDSFQIFLCIHNFVLFFQLS